MAIHRSGPVPPFYEYICGHALLPLFGPPSPQIKALLSPGQTINWIEIPSFQRGISWDIQKIEELLRSRSVLLGNAIISQFPVTAGQFQYLPPGQQQYSVLVDGLQRFAVGTVFLRLLHDRVLSHTPNRPSDAVHFMALAARVQPLAAFYFHNDVEFSQHPRKAISDQYGALRRAVEVFIEEEFNSGRGAQLASQVVPLFLTKQVALDLYFNFNRVDLLSTFIGINTVRVDLGPVDLLRSHILERATSAGWSSVQCEDAENDFTDSFTEEQKPKQAFLPFVNAAVRIISAGGGGARLFPSWSSTFLRSDVDDLLDFLDKFESSIPSNTFLREISECGSLPTSIAFAYYFSRYKHHGTGLPSFFTNGTAENQELHSLLRACYRLTLGGSIGRITPHLDDIVNGTQSGSLAVISDELSDSFVGRPLATPVDPQWLEQQLTEVDKRRAPRVFNALLLPPASSLGGGFSPFIYGRKSKHFQIDHLIPDSMITIGSGSQEAQTLRNFCPLPANMNRAAKATGCSSKLANVGIYANYVNGRGTNHPVHPYAAWLLQQAQGIPGHQLDDQQLLEKNSSPGLGSARLNWLTQNLIGKL
jgi:hypothetical protein